MMGRRVARQIAAALLYFAENASSWVFGLFFASVHMKSRELKAAAGHIFFKRRSDAREMEAPGDREDSV